MADGRAATAARGTNTQVPAAAPTRSTRWAPRSYSAPSIARRSTNRRTSEREPT